MINLSNFVDVNINYKITSSITSTRDTAVLIKTHTAPTASAQPSTKNVSTTFGKGDNAVEALVTTYTEIPVNDTKTEGQVTYKDINYVAEGDPLYYYYSMFFQNGGQKLMVISVEGANTSVLTTTKLSTIVKALDYKYVVITSTIGYAAMNGLASTINGDTSVNGCYQKKFITHITEEEYADEHFDITTIKKVENYAIKYGLAGIEMTMAAYLTQIDIDDYASVKDYAFTIEKVSYSYKNGDVTTVVGEAYSDNDLVTELMKANINVDGELVNAVRVLGGNDFGGGEFVNYYMLILLHQTLTERLVGVLTQKLKYNPQGLSIIGSAIGTELDRYVNCGYISTNDAWTDDSLYYQGNLIISKNTLLPLGYKYVVMPFSTLSETDRQEHKLPKIFVLISDGYSVRKIEIVGEVF